MHPRCLVRAHVDMLHHEPGRLYLRCTECGRETPGWTLDRPAPRVRYLSGRAHVHYGKPVASDGVRAGAALFAGAGLDPTVRPRIVMFGRRHS